MAFRKVAIFIFLSLLYLLIHGLFANTRPHETKCGTKEAPIELSTASGKIDGVYAQNQTCYWNMTISASDSRPLVFVINQLYLMPEDKFEVLTSKNQTFDLTRINDNGVVFTPLTAADGMLEIRLTTSDTKNTRRFDVMYAYNKKEIKMPSGIRTQRFHIEKIAAGMSPVKSADAYVFKYDGVNELTSTAVNLELPFDDNTIDAKIGDWVLDQAFDDKIFKDGFSVTIGNLVFDTSKDMVLNLDYYDSNCTEDRQIDGDSDFSTISSDLVYSKNGYQCVWIIRAKDASQVYLKDFKINSYYGLDSIEIRDGAKRTSPLITTINPPSDKKITEYRSNWLNTFSTSNKLHIVYKCPSFFLRNSPKEYISNSLKVSLAKQVQFYKGPNEQKISITADASNTSPILYSYETDAGQQVYFNVDKKQTFTGATIKLYNSFNSNNKPIATFTNDVPQQVWSDNHILVLELTNFTGSGQTLTGSFSSKNHTCDYVVTDESSIFIYDNATTRGATCNTLITPQSIGDDKVFTVKFNYMNLPTKSDCASLTTAVEKDTVFKYCGPSTTDIFPLIIVNTSKSYLLSYSHANAPEVPAGESLCEVTFAYNSAAEKIKEFNLTSGHSLNVTLPYYPNSYPIYYDKIGNYRINIPKYAYVKFDSLDLAAGDDLNFVYTYETAEVLKFDGNKLPQNDFISEKVIALTFNSNLTKRLEANDLFANGYHISIDAFDCGGRAHLNESSVKTPNYPNAFSNYTKCVWAINLPQKADDLPQKKQLNFTVNWGAEGTHGNLVVYDSATLRHPVKVNMTAEGGVYQSSAGSIIVEYTWEKTPVSGFNLSYTVNDCQYSTCDNKTRCLIPSIVCNGVLECQDSLDEMHCNSSPPPPPPEPAQVVTRGVSGWAIVFLIIPMAIAVGSLSTKYGPKFLTRFRGRQYQEFADFSEDG